MVRRPRRAIVIVSHISNVSTVVCDISDILDSHLGRLSWKMILPWIDGTSVCVVYNATLEDGTFGEDL
jgi:hypothetical protein